MAIRDTWHRALVYFGLAEDPEYDEHDIYEPETGAGGVYDAPPARPATVSRLGERRRARDEIDDIFADDEPRRPAHPRRCGRWRQRRRDVRVHLVTPYSFNDAQEVADSFKQDVPVILNLQTTDGELAKRLIDFTSGLTYALGRRHAEDRRQDLPADARATSRSRPRRRPAWSRRASSTSPE